VAHPGPAGLVRDEEIVLVGVVQQGVAGGGGQAFLVSYASASPNDAVRSWVSGKRQLRKAN
jgi:hypothetical protein